ncbi:MAG: hypothetical protein J5J00_05315 [Deltaproteobacteria bacterium]|nr:hypothetical protein [Deltaproteobacteria bacterium]
MPKEHFSVLNSTQLSVVPPGGSIHIIGVCGVAMAQLAVLLSEMGYSVSGSDKEFYEPMGSLLRSSKVKLFTGYASGNVPSRSDLVVIGNAISYGHVEVGVVEELNLPYTFFPKILDETVIGGRKSIVVTGTHGKSTTSAMIAALLYRLNYDPSYFIGGIAEDLPKSLHAGKGDFAVLEGDEYDSAFFAKVPKFAFYHPDVCVVNAIEYDHADIYPDLESINREFNKMIHQIPKEGAAICCIDFDNLKNLIGQWKQSAACRIVTFGFSEGADYRITARRQNGFQQTVTAKDPAGAEFRFTIKLPASYNALNALATLIAAETVGVSRDVAAAGIAKFTRVKRRQEVKFESSRVVLIEDFAHHPTAVDQTIRAVREAYPQRRLRAVFEPRSNTSRRKIFQQDYVRAFGAADEAILCNVASRASDEGLELIDVAMLSGEISRSGVLSACLADAGAIETHLVSSLGPSDVIVVMSNGSFGGLVASLQKSLKDLCNSK